MNRIRSIIIDDEKNSREVLKGLLDNFFPELDIVAEANNVDTAFEMIKIYQPDLIFLDIQMPKADGFSLLKRFDYIPFEIIFVTSYDHYAINAIKFSALDYLLKPVDISDLKNAIDRAINIIQHKDYRTLQVVNLIQDLDNEVLNKSITVHHQNKVKFIKTNDIIYIEAQGRYSYIYANHHETFVTPKTLKDFEDYFGEASPFIRINKSIIINALHVVEYSKGEPFIIQLTLNKVFEVSRRRKSEILEIIHLFS